jgi:type II secretory pathway pseudopilin PulG
MKNLPIAGLSKNKFLIGFTLVEMAVVLLIVSLLLGGLLPSISGQIEKQRRAETIKYIDEVRNSLLGFSVANGRLPCPDTTSDGVEDIAAAVTSNDVPIAPQSTKKFACGATAGTIPYNTLGVSPTDSYNSTLIYAVTPAFGERNEIWSANGGGGALLYSSFFKLTSAGTMQVCTAACAANLTTTAAAVIVSRGSNWATANSTDETENTNGDTRFISRDFVQNGFDDLVVWLSPNTLFNRMVAAGKLP